MVKNSPKLARLGGPLCLIILASTLLPLLLSAAAPQVAASSGEWGLIENFEDNSDWTGCKLDNYVKVEGEYSGLVGVVYNSSWSKGIYSRTPDAATMTKTATIDLTTITDLRFWRGIEAAGTGGINTSIGARLELDTVDTFDSENFRTWTFWSRNWKTGYGTDGIDNDNETYDVSDNVGNWYIRFNTYASGGGGGWILLNIDNLNGFSNWVLTIENITVNNSLIDRDLDYAGSGAVLTTTITIRVQDNDGYGEIQPIRLWIRDGNDSVAVDNLQITDNTIIDENTLDFTYTYNPPDNLPDDNLGAFDVQVVTEDIWGASDNNDWGGDGAALFTVDDLKSTINFDSASPFIGYNLNVSGTHSRIVGTVSIDASWLIDNKHGQFALGASNTYDNTYLISNATADENVSVTLRTRDAPLDGSSTSSYKTNENVKFEVWVRFEENYGLVGWVPDENRPLDLLFEWGGGTYPYTLTENPENITLPAGETSAKIVKITDNDAYWRYRISELPGGILTFVIVDDPSTVAQYRFFLQDYTGLYTPPDGQLLIKSWIGTNLAGINDDFWGADWRTTAWLVTGTQYQIWVRGTDAPLRLVGPIDAVTPTEEKTIIVQVVISELDPIFDYVYWAAWRVSDTIIRVEYQDNLDNTIEAHVGIYDMDDNLMSQYQPDNEWFIVTWPSAENTKSYEVVLTVSHGIYGDFTRSVPIGLMEGPPGVPGGVSEPFGLPAGLTLGALGSIILMFIVGLSFDAIRVQLGVLAMALTTLFCWYMGFLPLPGPYDGAFTATLILVAAVLFALTWRRGK